MKKENKSSNTLKTYLYNTVVLKWCCTCLQKKVKMDFSLISTQNYAGVFCLDDSTVTHLQDKEKTVVKLSAFLHFFY